MSNKPRKKKKQLNSVQRRAIESQVAKADTFFNAGLQAQIKADYTQARSLYRNALKNNAKHDGALTSLGSLDILDKHFDQAIDRLQSALRYNSSNYLAYYNLGLAYQNIEDYSQAEAAYYQVQALKPDHLNSLGNLGAVLFEQNKYDEAIAIYIKLLSLHSEHEQANYNLGCIFQARRMYDEAIGFYLSAFKLDQSHYLTPFNLGYCLSILARFDQAMHAYHQALSIKPDLVTAHTFLAILYWERNALDKCREHYQKLADYDQSAYSKTDNITVLAYEDFLGKLLAYRSGLDIEREQALYGGDDTLPCLTMIGDSHSLSYANTVCELAGTVHRVQSKVVVGCKAWRLSLPEENEFKDRLISILSSVEQGTSVVFSFGEIDCRVGSGILNNQQRTGNALKEEVESVVAGYVDFIERECKLKQLIPIYYGVAAPWLDKNLSQEECSRLVGVVRQFNDSLRDAAFKAKRVFLDTYRYSVNTDGFSRKGLHIDTVHLSPFCLNEIVANSLC